MAAVIIAIILFLGLAGAISWFGYRRYARPARVYDQLGGAMAVRMPAADGFAQGVEPDLPVRIIESIGEKLPVSPDDAGVVRRDLMAAGYRSSNAVTVFFGIRLIATALLIMLSLVLREFISIPVLKFVLIGAAAVLGWMGPGFVLDHLVSRRHLRLQHSLPDALDLMVVSVEAGLGLDQAIDHVSR